MNTRSHRLEINLDWTWIQAKIVLLGIAIFERVHAGFAKMPSGQPRLPKRFLSYIRPLVN